ncbi:MAG: IseA DL-endopeptidase inhibitor [Paenibacillus sp.]|nr:IseA DL-endopeptidase inhibitor [Paenibacillus sp.]
MNRKKVMQGIGLSLLINAGLPLLVYKLLEGGMSNVAALSIATVIPMADTLYHLLKHKKLDIFAAFMAVGFILSILAVPLGGSEKLICDLPSGKARSSKRASPKTGAFPIRAKCFVS